MKSGVTEVKVSMQRMRRRDRLAICGVVLLIVLLAVAVWCIFQPQNVSDLENKAATTVPRDLKEVFRKAVEGTYKVEIAEEEVNAYLAKQLVSQQNGVLGGLVKLEKVLIRMEDERVEIITVRMIAGCRFTTSIWVTIEQTENATGMVQTSVEPSGGEFFSFSRIKKGGRFGCLTVPQGFLLLTERAHAKLAAVFPEEIRYGIEEMSRIRIRRGVMELDPSYDVGISVK